MFKQFAAAAAAALALSPAFAGMAVVNAGNPGGNGSLADPYELGTLGSTPTVLVTTLTGTPGASFEEFANFNIATPVLVGGSANTYALSFYGVNLVDIDNLKVQVWNDSAPSHDVMYASFSGNNTTTTFNMLPGSYHLDITGAFGSMAHAGQYSVAMNAMPVPEPQTYALMLAGLACMAFIARRRRPQ
jgi:hypothetical protein